MVRIQCFHCCSPGSIPSVGLRAHKPCGAAKIKKKFFLSVRRTLPGGEVGGRAFKARSPWPV